MSARSEWEYRQRQERRGRLDPDDPEERRRDRDLFASAICNAEFERAKRRYEP